MRNIVRSNRFVNEAKFADSEDLLWLRDGRGADSDWVLRQIYVDHDPADSDWILRQIPHDPLDSDWVLRQVYVDHDPVDSEWVLRQIPHDPLDSDWVLRQVYVDHDPADSDWILRQIPTLQGADSDWVERQLTPLDSDWILRQIPEDHDPYDSDWILRQLTPLDSEWILDQIPDDQIDSEYVLDQDIYINEQFDSEFAAGLQIDGWNLVVPTEPNYNKTYAVIPGTGRSQITRIVFTGTGEATYRMQIRFIDSNGDQQLAQTANFTGTGQNNLAAQAVIAINNLNNARFTAARVDNAVDITYASDSAYKNIALDNTFTRITGATYAINQSVNRSAVAQRSKQGPWFANHRLEAIPREDLTPYWTGDSEWVIRQVVPGWNGDSDWILRQIPHDPVDSEWVIDEIYRRRTELDSDEIRRIVAEVDQEWSGDSEWVRYIVQTTKTDYDSEQDSDREIILNTVGTNQQHIAIIQGQLITYNTRITNNTTNIGNLTTRVDGFTITDSDDWQSVLRNATTLRTSAAYNTNFSSGSDVRDIPTRGWVNHLMTTANTLIANNDSDVNARIDSDFGHFTSADSDRIHALVLDRDGNTINLIDGTLANHAQVRFNVTATFLNHTVRIFFPDGTQADSGTLSSSASLHAFITGLVSDGRLASQTRTGLTGAPTYTLTMADYGPVQAPTGTGTFGTGSIIVAGDHGIIDTATLPTYPDSDYVDRGDSDLGVRIDNLTIKEIKDITKLQNRVGTLFDDDPRIIIADHFLTQTHAAYSYVSVDSEGMTVGFDSERIYDIVKGELYDITDPQYISQFQYGGDAYFIWEYKKNGVVQRVTFPTLLTRASFIDSEDNLRFRIVTDPNTNEIPKLNGTTITDPFVDSDLGRRYFYWAYQENDGTGNSISGIADLRGDTRVSYSYVTENWPDGVKNALWYDSEGHHVYDIDANIRDVVQPMLDSEQAEDYKIHLSLFAQLAANRQYGQTHINALPINDNDGLKNAESVYVKGIDLEIKATKPDLFSTGDSEQWRLLGEAMNAQVYHNLEVAVIGTDDDGFPVPNTVITDGFDRAFWDSETGTLTLRGHQDSFGSIYWSVNSHQTQSPDSEYIEFNEGVLVEIRFANSAFYPVPPARPRVHLVEGARPVHRGAQIVFERPDQWDSDVLVAAGPGDSDTLAKAEAYTDLRVDEYGPWHAYYTYENDYFKGVFVFRTASDGAVLDTGAWTQIGLAKVSEYSYPTQADATASNLAGGIPATYDNTLHLSHLEVGTRVEFQRLVGGNVTIEAEVTSKTFDEHPDRDYSGDSEDRYTLGLRLISYPAGNAGFTGNDVWIARFQGAKVYVEDSLDSDTLSDTLTQTYIDNSGLNFGGGGTLTPEEWFEQTKQADDKTFHRNIGTGVLERITITVDLDGTNQTVTQFFNRTGLTLNNVTIYDGNVSTQTGTLLATKTFTRTAGTVTRIRIT